MTTNDENIKEGLIRERTRDILRDFYIKEKKQDIISSVISFYDKETHKRVKKLVRKGKEIIDFDYRDEKGNKRIVNWKSSAYFRAYYNWNKHARKEASPWIKNSKVCKTRLIYLEELQEYFWECKKKDKKTGKWMKTKLCPNTISDNPKQRKKEIIKYAQRGIPVDAIVYIINHLRDDGVCEKGIKKSRVYKILKEIRPEKYASIECPIIRKPSKQGRKIDEGLKMLKQLNEKNK